MDFWFSILGNHLAHVLIRELPKLTERQVQYIKKLPKSEVIGYVEAEIENGSLFVNRIDDGEQALVIMQKSTRKE